MHFKNEFYFLLKQKVKEFDLKMSEERKKRLADRKEKRKEDRRTKWIEEKREAEQRAKDEELLRGWSGY